EPGPLREPGGSRARPRRPPSGRARVKGITPMWQGHVVSLHIAPEASAKMETVTEVRAVPGRGLEGDRYFKGTGFYSPRPSHGGREVTLIETESVEALDGGVLSATGDTLGINLRSEERRVGKEWRKRQQTSEMKRA